MQEIKNGIDRTHLKLLRQLDIQHHGLYLVQILLAEPWKIDTSEIDMALLQQIEKMDVIYHPF